VNNVRVAKELVGIARDLTAATDIVLEHHRFVGALRSFGSAVSDFREALRNDGRPEDGDQFFLEAARLTTQMRQLSDKYKK